MDKRISIFVCGVQRGGTTSLYAYLREHSALSPPSVKEIHFFDNETLDWAKPDYAPLDSYFASNEGERQRFEATPIYAFWSPSLRRIHAYNPAAKLIFLFRDPFERAWSQWQMEYERGEETLSFATAIREGRRRMDGLPLLAPERRVYSYIERGFYAEQIMRALTYFPRDQMLFLRSQDLYCDHVGTLKRIADFLRIEPFSDAAPKWENRRPKTFRFSAPNKADKAHVAELLRENVRAFSASTGLKVSDWPIMLE